MAWLIVFLFVACSYYLGIKYLCPTVNRFFSIIWDDPTISQRPQVVKRLKELMVDGDVPAETAVLMAAKENRVEEKQLLGIMDETSVEDLSALMSGRRSGVVSGFLGLLKKRLKANTSRRKRKR